MEILTYGNYEGSIEYDGLKYRGKILNINDLILYEAHTYKQLQFEFKLAVIDYIDTCKLVGKMPQ